MLPIFHALLVREKVTNRHSEALRAEKMPIENKKQNTSGNASLITHYVPHDSHNVLKSLYKTQVAGAAATLLKRTYSLINLFSYSLRKRAAFTLAEVLITLGIIGVVAAITMPALIQNYTHSVAETRLKKFYSDMNQAILQSIVDNGEVESWSYFNNDITDDEGNKVNQSDKNDESFQKYLAPYLKITHKTIYRIIDLRGYCSSSIDSYATKNVKKNVDSLFFCNNGYSTYYIPA